MPFCALMLHAYMKNTHNTLFLPYYIFSLCSLLHTTVTIMAPSHGICDIVFRPFEQALVKGEAHI